VDLHSFEKHPSEKPDQDPHQLQFRIHMKIKFKEVWRLNMEPWRLTLELWRLTLKVCGGPNNLKFYF
jgi:hypothetical protein